MTKKDYIELAKMFKDIKNKYRIESYHFDYYFNIYHNSIVKILSDDNPEFNEEEFKKQSGISDIVKYNQYD